MKARDKKAEKKLGQNIRSYRLKMGMTQEEVANRAGITANFVGMVERGERNVTFRNLLRISRGLKCPLARILGGIR